MSYWLDFKLIWYSFDKVILKIQFKLKKVFLVIVERFCHKNKLLDKLSEWLLIVVSSWARL